MFLFSFYLKLISFIIINLVCHEPFEEEEKKFIVQWIENNQGPNGSISWNVDLVNYVQKIKLKIFGIQEDEVLLFPGIGLLRL